MMINDENKKDLKKMLRGRALYLALGAIVLAAGVISYTSLGKNLKPEITVPVTEERQTHINVNERILPEDEPYSPEPVSEPASEHVSEPEPISELIPETSPAVQEVFDNAEKPSESETEAKEISYSLPLGSSMSRDYSMGIPVFSATMNDYRTHNGVDFTAEKGTGVKAIAEGKVTEVSSDALWGNSVYVDHGQGVVSKISGLADEGLITEGMDVNCDTVIGVVGEVPVENADGSHIHLEIRVNGKIADPMEIMGLVPDGD
ncbi:MAG: M23 family metallopeptidase [Clostridia bacterium]|nr:M23 family metallopeptidase [Clostridia bacterium]